MNLFLVLQLSCRCLVKALAAKEEQGFKVPEEKSRKTSE